MLQLMGCCICNAFPFNKMLFLVEGPCAWTRALIQFFINTKCNMHSHCVCIIVKKCPYKLSGESHKRSMVNTKQSMERNRSVICIAGFTQPDSLRKLIDCLQAEEDGLLDRLRIDVIVFVQIAKSSD